MHTYIYTYIYTYAHYVSQKRMSCGRNTSTNTQIDAHIHTYIHTYTHIHLCIPHAHVMHKCTPMSCHVFVMFHKWNFTIDILHMAFHTCCLTHDIHVWWFTYGVASVSRIDKITGLFCKRALQKRRYSAKETYNFIDPTDRSHPMWYFALCRLACHATAQFTERESMCVLWGGYD